MGNNTGIKRTDEHIFPKSLLGLYPEQDITYKDNNKYVDNRGLTISDVCNECNNGFLAELDSYGQRLISNSFMTPYKFSDYYVAHHIVLDDVTTFSRWILKIIYNGSRLEKREDSYFDNLLPYIMGEKIEYPSNISMFLGLHINLNPVPENYFSYTPLQIYYQPKLLRKNFKEISTQDNSAFLSIDAIDTVCLRFGNLIVFSIIWKDGSSTDYRENIINIMQAEYRFRLLSDSETDYSVRCVSSPTNVILGNYAHLLNEKSVSLIINEIKQSLGGRDIGKAYNDSLEYFSPDFLKKGRVAVEALEFPNNKRKQQDFERILKQ